jgi:hypothetical protein
LKLFVSDVAGVLNVLVTVIVILGRSQRENNKYGAQKKQFEIHAEICKR